MDPQGKTFIVTGGGSGLGAACVERLIHAGANAVIADIRVDADATHDEHILRVQTDVSDDASIADMVAQATAKFGTFHGVLNCAGIGRPGRVVGRDGMQDLSVWLQTIAINLTGTFNVIRHAVALMSTDGADPAEEERGVIVNTASAAAFDGQIGQAPYAASKGGVVALTLPLAREFARHRIRVNTIAPGIFETPILGTLTDEARASIASQVPFPRRLGLPDEYAALAEHMIRNPMLNGEVVRLDGALRLSPT